MDGDVGGGWGGDGGGDGDALTFHEVREHAGVSVRANGGAGVAHRDGDGDGGRLKR